MTKSGLASNVFNTNATLTSDPSVTTLSGSSQTGGDVSTDPGAATLGAYGFNQIAGGGQENNTTILLNFDRGGGTDFEVSSNVGNYSNADEIRGFSGAGRLVNNTNMTGIGFSASTGDVQNFTGRMYGIVNS